MDIQVLVCNTAAFLWRAILHVPAECHAVSMLERK